MYIFMDAVDNPAFARVAICDLSPFSVSSSLVSSLSFILTSIWKATLRNLQLEIVDLFCKFCILDSFFTSPHFCSFRCSIAEALVNFLSYTSLRIGLKCVMHNNTFFLSIKGIRDINLNLLFV